MLSTNVTVYRQSAINPLVEFIYSPTIIIKESPSKSAFGDFLFSNIHLLSNNYILIELILN